MELNLTREAVLGDLIRLSIWFKETISARAQTDVQLSPCVLNTRGPMSLGPLIQAQAHETQRLLVVDGGNVGSAAAK